MSLATGKDLHRTIELAGQWLSGKAYDERAFDAYDRGLNQHLREALGAAARCDVTLERNASVAPYPGVGEKMVCKIALATLNSLLEEYGSARVANLPDAMTAHFASQCSGRHGAVDSYLQQLDPAVLAYLDQAGEMHGFPLDQLKIYHHFAGEHATVTRNRLQAIRALPWLLTALSEPDATRAGFGADASAGSRQRPVEQIARAIDEATPLVAVVSSSFGVPRETVRWLGRRRLPAAWTLDAGRVELLLRLLSWIAPEHRPRNEAEFEIMVKIGNALLAPFRFVSGTNSVEQLREPRYGLSIRRWYSELTRAGLAAAYAAIDMGRLERDLADAKDFLDALYHSVHRFCRPEAPGIVDATDRNLRFVLDWTRTKSLRSLSDLSRQWHDAIERFPAPAGQEANWQCAQAHPYLEEAAGQGNGSPSLESRRFAAHADWRLDRPSWRDSGHDRRLRKRWQ